MSPASVESERERDDTRAEYPQEKCIHQIFEEQVERTPGAIAVVYKDERLTYRELNERANQLAHYLRKLGVGPEVLVGICVERSLEMIVGLLGILKAGGVYVPLDPTYPQERLSFMLDDAKAGLLLTQQRLRKKLDSYPGETITLDADWVSISKESDQNPVSRCTAENLAYVIYTSGSTGRPKGVCVRHSSVVHLVRECQSDFNFGIDDVWTVVHSYAFDFSVWEIFGALLSGSRLVIVPLSVTQSPAGLYQLLREERVTVLNQTPSAARQLVDLRKDLPPNELSLRLFICGGEALPSNLAPDLLGWKVPLWNFYGPTESTVWATVKEVGPDDIGQRSVPIGSAIRGLTTYVLDENLELAPAGSEGELHIGGTGLARGYLNRPELTAERFIPDSFRSELGTTQVRALPDPGGDTRLYKTGDLARYLPNGDIEHLGRMDHQVKVRGFRIELEEIESVIAEHPLVSEAVVAAREEQGLEKRLVAYVTKIREDHGELDRNLDDQRLADWKSIWDETYSQSVAQDDPTFNIIGWNSSYTGLPYSSEEMREWVDQTVHQILALRPRRLLEIGCGSGLLLFRIAPRCEYYVATDLSEVVLTSFQRELSARDDLAQVTLLQRMADDFGGFEPESFDTVIINSVVQYFPSVEYLLRVLEGAVRVTKSGGTVFIGDLRNLSLLEAFHVSTQMAQAPNTLSVIDLRERVRRNMLQDEQLAIDPALFEVLKADLPRVCDVELQLKRGRYQNETTKFRYDVRLRVGSAAPVSQKQSRLDWSREQLSVAEIRRVMLESRPESLLITSVPNARLISEMDSVELLSAEGFETVADLRTRSHGATNRAGVDPEEWRAIGDECGRSVVITWSSGKAECYDVEFKSVDERGQAVARLETHCAATTKDSLRRFGNDPLQGAFTRRLLPQLRAFLRERLPEYMIPTTFVLLDALPLTPNAKIDRAALPAPDSARPELEEAFVPPRNGVEARLAEIWSAALKLDRVGVHDNFIELGGHSVLATQITSRVRDAFGVELPLWSVFESPSVAAMAVQIETRRAEQTREVTPLRRVRRDSNLPLSFAQQRLWFLDQLVPETPVYNIPAVVHLSCSLNVVALEKSLNEVVRRHESLRTTIAVINGEPHQIVAKELDLQLQVIDLSNLPVAERETETQKCVRREAETLFDLARGPLLRTRLLRVGHEEYVLLVTMHHIISDNWSIVVFFEELSALYEAFSAGRTSPLAELPIQYADYALWQRDEEQQRAIAKQLAYWKQQLSDAPTAIDLPTDNPRPAMVSFRGDRESLTLPKHLVRALRIVGQSEGSTTFMMLLAVFSILLHRLTGQEDILLGSPIANRVRTEVEGVIGLFLNNLVLRTRPFDDLSSREFVAQVRETALGAYAHQDVPFERLVEELQPVRDPSRSPLFQVFFNLFDAADNRIELAGVKTEVFSPIEAWTQFDLTLYAAERGQEIDLTLAYNADLFGRARITEMLRQFRRLLEQIVAEPEKQISDHSLVTPESRELLPNAEIELSQPCHEAITETFFLIAKTFPNHEAIRKGDDSWTYEKLSQQAREIARMLLADGLQKGDVVAVRGASSFGLIASMLGVLASGGVLLTLDLNLPSDRQKLMIREGAAGRLIDVGDRIEDAWLQEIPALKTIPIRESDGVFIDRANGAHESTELPKIDLDEPAYIFFTSGTTGVPKGVLGSHKGLSHFLKWQREQFAIGPDDICAQLTRLSFDVVLRDIFLPLTSGASLHLPDDPSDVISGRILSWLERQQITVLHTVPTLAQTWLNAAPEAIGLRSLRWAFFAGEPLTDSLVRRWREVLSTSGKIVNLYGPTETTLAKCFYVVPDEPLVGVQPVGSPLPNSQALVLNRTNVPCGIGEPGEIVIRTPFRTLGFINEAGEHGARFIRNPFTEDPNDLIYRTGDRGRYRPGGSVEILGRFDDQIKIRGIRVEPSEVSATLSQHHSVSACVVVPTTDERGENELAAYVVGEEGRPLTILELRSHLERQLPPAMVPSYFVFMDQLPLTQNGKVNRAALPEPDRSRQEIAAGYVAPRNETEAVIASVWSEVLGLERVGVCDSFFALGGHSLKATQVISRIGSLFNTDLPLRTIFEKNTVAGLSEAVEDQLVAELQAMSEDEAHHLL